MYPDTLRPRCSSRCLGPHPDESGNLALPLVHRALQEPRATWICSIRLVPWQ